MRVHELIELLKTFPQDLEVTYARFSEQCLLESTDIAIGQACPPRPDGWVQNYRKDMPHQDYLMLPGN